jgi:hypothetical protein
MLDSDKISSDKDIIITYFKKEYEEKELKINKNITQEKH